MEIIADKQKIKTLLTRAVSDVLVKENLEKKLDSGKKLRIKFGIDPTAPDIHLGHTVPLLKLRQFQELGHQAVLIIGDFTARIGDPTGRLEARKPLSESEVKRNMKNYLKQVAKVIDIKKTKIHYNSEWFNKMTAREFLELANKATVQQVTKREDFKNRIKENMDITGSEIMYPLLQGYDSVMVKSDVEIGGEDQLLNLLMGRRIQRAYNVSEQSILTTWLIEGTDGVKKMSKSSGNYISITEKPEIMFGKIMSILDSLIIKYFKALTVISDSEIDIMEMDLKSGKSNPRDAKNKLSYEIVKIYHGEKKAQEAEEEFNRVFKKKELPKEMPSATLQKGDRNIIDLLITLSLAPSKSQARRLVLGRAVKIGGEISNEPKAIVEISEGLIIQVGKRHFVKIKIAPVR